MWSKCTVFIIFKGFNFFYLKQGSQSFIALVIVIKEKAAFYALGNFHNSASALLFAIGKNEVQLYARFLKVEKCMLDQALSIAQK